MLCPLEPLKDGGSKTASVSILTLSQDFLPGYLLGGSSHLVSTFFAPIDKPFRPFGRGPTPPVSKLTKHSLNYLLTGMTLQVHTSPRKWLVNFGPSMARLFVAHLLNNLYKALGSGQQNRKNHLTQHTPESFIVAALLHPFNEL